MKKQRLFPLLAGLVLLAAGSVQAQNGGVKANIPFDFTAGSMTLPAGEYSITRMSDFGGILLVAGSSSSKDLVRSQAVENIAAPTSTQLVFHRYGNRYFLYQIWVRGENRGRELPQTRLERELASNRQPAPVAVLASK
ncbi:MAG TPA: hypothetical protein VJX16_25215 [Terriglobales bacterium]|nr:hypothetical protein [Terriglobales bacterium]